MSDDLVSRKNFVLLTLGLAGGALLSTACGEDPGPADGSGGSSKGGSPGTGGGAGSTSGSSNGGSPSGGTGQGGGAGSGTAGGAGGSAAGAGGTGGASGGSSGSSNGSGGSGGGAGACAAVAIEISCNHDHVLVIPAEDVMSGQQTEYTMSDNGTHDHTITVTAAHFTTLQAGGTVHIYVDSQIQPHCVTLTCGQATDPSAAECANDSMECV